MRRGEGEVGQVTTSAIEGQGAGVVIKRIGSGEFGRIVTVGRRERVILGRPGAWEREKLVG